MRPIDDKEWVAAMAAGDWGRVSQIQVEHMDAAFNWKLPPALEEPVAACLGLTLDGAARQQFRLGGHGPEISALEWVEAVCRFYLIAQVMPPDLARGIVAADYARALPTEVGSEFLAVVERYAHDGERRPGPKVDLVMDRFVEALAGLWIAVHGKLPRRSFDWRSEVNREVGAFRRLLTILLAEIDPERPVPQFARRLKRSL